MRIDSCKKCGIELREYDDSEKCQACGQGFTQFVCAGCQLITEPQYHIHRNAVA
ncbi:MAG: hypothetical protein ACT4NT_02200 [Nitrososphaerota archaeon]